jgi:hypothetical protein
MTLRLTALQLVQAAAHRCGFLLPAISGLPEMQTFECRSCRLAVTAEQVLQFPELLAPMTA